MKISLRWLYDVKSFACLIIAIVAIVTLIGGLYILSPIFATIAQSYDQTSPILAGLVSYGAVPIVGGILVAIPSVIFAGLRLQKHKVVRRGAFALALSYIFLAALRVFAIGLFPLTWLNLLAIGIIVGLCWLVIE